MSEQSTHNMSINRRFAASVARVWEAWSEADQVMRWWGPVGFTSPLYKMDSREGGTTLVCMKAPAISSPLRRKPHKPSFLSPNSVIPMPK